MQLSNPDLDTMPCHAREASLLVALRSQVAYAARTVPFWADRLSRNLGSADAIRTIDDFADHLCHHEGVDRDPDLGGRTGDRRLEFFDRHRCDHLGPVAQQFAETAMA